jgi:hypothetical protein
VRQQDGKPSLMARLAAAPIARGVCEVPGWARRLWPGGARIDEVVRLLDEAGREPRLVLQRDVAITGPEPAVESGPALDVRKSIEFVSIRAPRREVSHT